MKIVTRQEAKARGETSFFTGIPCIRGHLAQRGTANGMCRQCQREAMKRWRETNAELDREKCREWYSKNKDHAKAWKKNWIDNNRDLYLANRRKWRMRPETRAKEMFAASRWSSKKKGMECTIDIQWIRDRLAAGVCELTGIPFNLEPLENGRQNPYTATLDRIDCSIGYVPGNVRMILWALNAAFNTYGEGVYADIARVYLARHPSSGTGLT